MYLVLFVIYLLVIGYLAGLFIQHWFGLSKVLAWWAGIVASLYALSFLGSVFLVLWTYKAWEVWVVAMAWGSLVVFLLLRYGSYRSLQATSRMTIGVVENPPPNLPLGARGRKTDPSSPPLTKGRNFTFLPSAAQGGDKEGGRKWIVLVSVIWLLLATIWLATLWSGRSGALQLSPWASLSTISIYAFFLLTLVTTILIFLRCKTIWLLGLLMAYSLLLHAYLPIVYQDGFGGDRWRHVATERWLQDGKIFSPALFGESPMRLSGIGPFKIPTVFVVGNKTSYASQWFWELMWQEVTGVDLLKVDIWFFPIFWSLVFPLLMYALAGLLFKERTPRLLAVLATSLFYPLQVYGAVTLPNAFSFIPFLMGVYAWLKWQLTQEKKWLILASVLTVTLYFGYILYFILLMLMGVFLWAKQKWSKKQWLWLVALLAVALPLIEMIQGTSYLTWANLQRWPSLAWESWLRLSALKGTTPLTGFLDQGNFIYNQTVNSIVHFSFLPRGLTLVGTWLIWGVVILGLVTLWRGYGSSVISHKSSARILSVSLVLLLFNFFVSWTLLSGVHVLARRLDLSLAVLLALFVASGLWFMLQWLSRRGQFISGLILISFGFAYLTSSTMASGPRLQTIPHDAFLAMQFVMTQEAGQTEFLQHPCVLADTWPLLALEAESRRQIVAGGFPLYDPDYSQPERVQLFAYMNRFSSVRYLEKSLQVTGAPYCYFITEPRFLWAVDKIKGQQVMWKILGRPIASFGNVWVWKYDSAKN